MDWWTAIGFFILGAAAGALLTRISYGAQIRQLRVTIEALLARSAQNLPSADDDPQRKSA